MTQYARVLDQTSVEVNFIESSDPDDLQNRINAFLGTVDADTAVTALTLAGSGDGQAFLAIVETADLDAVSGSILTGVTNGVQTTVVRCYRAADSDEMLAARQRAGTPAPVNSISWSIADEQLSGGSQGTPFMGMTVYSLSASPQNIGLVYGQAVLEATPQVLAPGANILSFESLGNSNQFELPAAQTLQYVGGAVLLALYQANVTVEQDAANDVTLQVVADPIGAPLQFGATTLTHVGAGLFDNISLQFVSPIEPPALSVPGSKYGLKITAGGAGQVKSASLLITQL